MVDDSAIDALLEQAEEANIKLPRGKKASREALASAVESGGGLDELTEQFGIKKRKAAPKKKAKKEEEEEDGKDGGEPAAPTPKKARKPKAELKHEEPEIEHPPLGTWDIANPVDKTALRDAATKLLPLLRERGVKVPTDDTVAEGQIAAEVLSNTESGKLDADGVVASLSERYGTEAADRKKNRNLAGDVNVPENKPIVEMLREIGAQYFKQAAPQKGATFQKAGTAVRDCTWAITLEDLPTAKAGARKLQNVGKGIIDGIREFLETGTCGRLEELRAAA